jgi:hypothetical protein
MDGRPESAATRAFAKVVVGVERLTGQRVSVQDGVNRCRRGTIVRIRLIP